MCVLLWIVSTCWCANFCVLVAQAGSKAADPHRVLVVVACTQLPDQCWVGSCGPGLSCCC